MTWFLLADGVPQGPSYNELLTGQEYPQPQSFLTRMFHELAGITLGPPTELVREKVSYEETVRGYCGDANVGFTWRGTVPVNDTALPIDESYVTYGLREAALIWSVAYRKQGQWGHAAWSCNYLLVRPVGPALDIMIRVWAEVFDVAPVFAPVPPAEDQGYENLVRQREEQLRADLRLG